MKISRCLLAALFVPAFVLANDRMRDVQAELKNQGFYYGEVDGNEGTETTAAIRRYQIRNGLSVTGKLDDQTLAALGMAPPPKAAAAPPAPKAPAPQSPAQVNPPAVNRPDEPPVASGRPRQDLLREAQDGIADDSGLRRSYPDDPAVVSPPTRIPSAVDNEEYETFFHGTPYASAPLEVQFDIVRKAQTLLSRSGYYQGAINGLPATLTSDALFSYQTKHRLPRTGRLDLQTLADLNLLPGRGDAPGIRGFYDPNRRRDRSVDLRGIIR